MPPRRPLPMGGQANFYISNSGDLRSLPEPISFESSQVPMLSQSERVIDVIRTAATAQSVSGFFSLGLPLATVLQRFRQVFSERVHSGQ